MTLLARIALKQCTTLGRQKAPAFMCIASKTTGTAQQQIDDYVARNQTRNRPTSPHLTIYTPQLTSMLSITHRGTGIWMATATSCFAFATLLRPETVDSMLAFASSLHGSMLGSAVLFEAKMAIAWPFMFHACNGLRHLIWDQAKGLGIKEVYTSGWTVLGLSTILSVLMVMMY
uniref:Succinate dehydrogenase cytochrome b560 subunit, mitochondrial n=1 Tax=Phallusia mammillata TaxID=59560 RepID=A0A6F9DRW9_9ASCI|nr:succinate dehydrogenase cytochrome b560 subunit, mitochondrial-like [Phallusia mammillata]